MESHLACVFCGSERAESLRIPSGGHSCLACARQLGVLLQGERRLLTIWPALLEEDDDDEPEPRVRLPDGRKVELRQRTEELKRELTVAQRAELADTYVKIGLHHEALVECSMVLLSGELEPGERVLEMLFNEPLAAPDAVERVRPFLLPV